MPRKRFEHFTHFIFTNPSIVCFATFILAFILPIVLLCIFPLGLGNNPEKVKYIILKLFFDFCPNFWAKIQNFLTHLKFIKI